MEQKIEIRCRKSGCNQLLVNYYPVGNNVKLHLSGFELKCIKCKRVFRLENYTENMLLKNVVNGVVRM